MSSKFEMLSTNYKIVKNFLHSLPKPRIVLKSPKNCQKILKNVKFPKICQNCKNCLKNIKVIKITKKNCQIVEMVKIVKCRQNLKCCQQITKLSKISCIFQTS